MPTLKDVYSNDFRIGAAVGPAVFLQGDPAASDIVITQFNAVTAENDMKWASLHPSRGHYDFEKADAFVQYATDNALTIHGHTLVWHHQTPDWIFKDPNEQSVQETLRDHIRTVVGRYKGRVESWDVVNEAIDDQGQLRRTAWKQALGDSYIEMAFLYANQADPQAKLYYNDYNLVIPVKQQRAIALVRSLKEKGIPIHGIGIQGHWGLEWPSIEAIETAIVNLAETGLQIRISELDVSVLPTAPEHHGADLTQKAELRNEIDPYTAGLPKAMQVKLARRYESLFALFHKHREKISGVTFWGVTDQGSWLNDWPVAGRTNYPLLFDRRGRSKPAFFAVLRAAKQSPPHTPHTQP